MLDADKLTPADPSDLTDAIAYALRFQGRKRVHNADEIMAEIVAKRLVEHLERRRLRPHEKAAEIGAARWEEDSSGDGLLHLGRQRQDH